MNKVTGTKSDFSAVREEGSRIVIGYGLTKIDKNQYEWYETYLYKKQISQLTLQVVKDAVFSDINADTVSRITQGFAYTVKHGTQAGTAVNVWLSKENQSDFHAMHQNASGMTFPVLYKVGELDGTPVYEEFADADEMHEICTSITTHILECQQSGWDSKDAIDWTPFEELFPENEQAPGIGEG